jgi:uncharacterized membrane-anchored protein
LFFNIKNGDNGNGISICQNCFVATVFAFADFYLKLVWCSVIFCVWCYSINFFFYISYKYLHDTSKKEEVIKVVAFIYMSILAYMYIMLG